MIIFIISGEEAACHPMVVWSEDGNIRSEHLLVVPCVFLGYQNRVPMRLEEGTGKAQDKSHGEGRSGIHQDKVLQKREIRDLLIGQEPQPFLLMGFP